LTDAVTQRQSTVPVISFSFGRRRRGYHLDAGNQDTRNGHIIQRTPSNLCCLPGIISLIILCIGIIFR